MKTIKDELIYLYNCFVLNRIEHWYKKGGNRWQLRFWRKMFIRGE